MRLPLLPALATLALAVSLGIPRAAPASAVPPAQVAPGADHGHEGHSDQIGQVHFTTSCSPAAQQEFNRAVALLHSFWFEPAREAFTAVASLDPGCAMAHWGIAMTWRANPLAGPPSAEGIRAGWAAVEQARTVGTPTQRERDYIAAIEAFYRDADTVDHRTRSLAYEQAMERVYQAYPDD